MNFMKKLGVQMHMGQFQFKFHALAALNIYYRGTAEISRQALTEFLHNMSHKALNKDNNNVFTQFDRMAELILELIFVMLDRGNKILNIANVINDNTDNETNNYQFTFDDPTEIDIEKNMEDVLKNKKNTIITSFLCSATIVNSKRNRS